MPQVSLLHPRIQYLVSDAFEKAKNVQPVANARIHAIIAHRWGEFGASNSKKTHPFQARWGTNEHCIHLHAEINAIRKASDFIDLEGTTMVVARAKKAGPRGPYIWGMAKPCLGCQRALAAFGIDHVYYTTDTEGVIECL